MNVTKELKDKINEFIEQALEVTKERYRKEYAQVGSDVFYDRMTRDACFLVWSGMLNRRKIYQEIWENRRLDINNSYEPINNFYESE